MTNWRKKAVQSRSRSTEKALARAARELLDDKGFEQTRVDEVAQRAGTSVGGFYARFKGKSALLHLADIDFIDACLEAFDEAVPEDFDGDIFDLLRSYIRVMVFQFDKHRDSILQVLRHASEDESGEFRLRTTEFNNKIHGRMRKLLMLRKISIAHPDPEFAINMTLFMASAAAREAVLRNALHAYPVDISLEELIDVLVSSASLYLTIQQS